MYHPACDTSSEEARGRGFLQMRKQAAVPERDRMPSAARVPHRRRSFGRGMPLSTSGMRSIPSNTQGPGGSGRRQLPYHTQTSFSHDCTPPIFAGSGRRSAVRRHGLFGRREDRADTPVVRHHPASLVVLPGDGRRRGRRGRSGQVHRRPDGRGGAYPLRAIQRQGLPASLRR